MKKGILFVAASMLVAMAAHAGTSMQAADKTADPPQTEPAPDSTDEPVRKSRLADRSEADRNTGTFVFKDNCLRFTGSRLLRDDRGDNQRCVQGNGRVYIREDADISVTQMLR